MSSVQEAGREPPRRESGETSDRTTARVSPRIEPPGEALRPPVAFWQRWPVVVLGTVALFGLLCVGLRYLAESFAGESTDDAFIDAHVVSLAPRVAGQIQKIYVTDNQLVKAGDLVAELDPRDLQAQVDQKSAALNAARANVELLKADVDLALAQQGAAEATARQSQAKVEAAQSADTLAKADLKRAQDLIERHTISPQEFDRSQTTMQQAQSELRAAEQKAAGDQAKVTQAVAQVEASRRAVQRAEAQTSQAEAEQQTASLNLSYARIVAPVDGRVTRKTAEQGDYVEAGRDLMALVPPQIWVTANFKENQVQRIRAGQPVKIRIDSVAGGPFRGHVDSIQAGSGARFSLLPPENAVGNFVKVVQRVPVKILFDSPGPLNSGEVLGPGLSVVPWVKVGNVEFGEAVTVLVAGVVALGVGLLWGVIVARRRRGQA